MASSKDGYPSNLLFDEIATFIEPGSYPPGIKAVPFDRRIVGQAFFPGGDGVHRKEGNPYRPPFPFGKVMIVGRDFDTEDNFLKVAPGEGESAEITWKTLLCLLLKTGIQPEACFYTNAFMGLRTTFGNTNEMPGHRDPTFRKACSNFFHRQIEFVGPRLLLTLGKDVAKFAAESAENLPFNWRSGTWRGIDETEGPLIRDVRFGASAQTIPAVAALLHPANRRPNLRWRKYKNDRGEAAEVRMLEEAVELCGGHASLLNHTANAAR